MVGLGHVLWYAQRLRWVRHWRGSFLQYDPYVSVLIFQACQLKALKEFGELFELASGEWRFFTHEQQTMPSVNRPAQPGR